jgi:hypothetical protein
VVCQGRKSLPDTRAAAEGIRTATMFGCELEGWLACARQLRNAALGFGGVPVDDVLNSDVVEAPICSLTTMKH